jgi:hypothetical protein
MQPITFVKIALVLGVLVSAITMSVPLFVATVAGSVVLAVLWLHKTKNTNEKKERAQIAQPAQPAQPARLVHQATDNVTKQPSTSNVLNMLNTTSTPIRTGSFPLPANANPSDYETLESKTARTMSARNKFLGLRGRIGDRYGAYKKYGTSLPLTRGMRNVRLSSSVSQ